MTPAPIPQDPRHQRFAEEYARCAKATDAYLAAGYKVTRSAASSGATRLLARADVRRYLEYLRQEASEMAQLTIAEILGFLTKIVRTPIGKLDEDDEITGPLIKSVSRSESEMGSTSRVEKLDPLKAVEIYLRITQGAPEEKAAAVFARALADLSAKSSPLPKGKI